MNRYQIVVPILVAPMLACQAQQSALKPHQLKSGRVIYPKMFGPMIAPNMPKEKIFVFSYQTQLKTSDLKNLQQEAEDFWQEVMPDFDRIPGITMAILQADEEPTGTFITHNNSYKFVIEKKSDGTWQWFKDKPKGQ